MGYGSFRLGTSHFLMASVCMIATQFYHAGWRTGGGRAHGFSVELTIIQLHILAELQCLVRSGDRWESLPFYKSYWQSLVQPQRCKSCTGKLWSSLCPADCLLGKSSVPLCDIHYPPLDTSMFVNLWPSFTGRKWLWRICSWERIGVGRVDQQKISLIIPTPSPCCLLNVYTTLYLH